MEERQTPMEVEAWITAMKARQDQFDRDMQRLKEQHVLNQQLVAEVGQRLTESTALPRSRESTRIGWTATNSGSTISRSVRSSGPCRFYLRSSLGDHGQILAGSLLDHVESTFLDRLRVH